MVTFAVAACSQSTSAPPRTHDPCEPLQLIAPNATAEQLAAIDHGVALWGDPSIGRAVTADDSIEITFQASGPAMFGLYDDAIFINQELSGTKEAITIAHELGHAFGLVHVPIGERLSVMNPGNLTVEPTADDTAAVAAIWGTCP